MFLIRLCTEPHQLDFKTILALYVSNGRGTVLLLETGAPPRRWTILSVLYHLTYSSIVLRASANV